VSKVLELPNRKPPTATYHTPDFLPSTSFEELCAFIEGRREAPGTFEDFERELRRRVAALESDLIAAQLARYDVDAEAIVVGGQEMRRCLTKEPKRYLSGAGPITVARNLFRPSGGGKSVCPLELRAGMVAGLCTPVLC
jgi:hypothetical protein